VTKISDIPGLKIYTVNSDYVGIARDVLIDPTEGKVKYLLKTDAESLLGRELADARKIFKENFIPFERVMSIRDIIVLK
jgi:sporulation protein YlmC with PRC-barrel domain